MPPLNPWREFARKASQALRRQLAQTEQGLAALFNPARAPQAIPVPLPRRRTPRFPGDKRYYTQSALPKRSSSGSNGIAPFAKTEFGRALTRPRLSAGTTRTYGRNFSTGSINHAQVAREVYQSISLGIRAGVLNTPYYPPPTGHHAGHVLCGVRSQDAVCTHLTFSLTPTPVLPSTGTLSPSTVSEIDDVLCAVPQFFARLRRDLDRLWRRGGAFEYRLLTHGHGTDLRISFHGRHVEEVERFLSDIGVSSGTLVQESMGFQTPNAAAPIDWRATQDASTARSLHDFVDALDRDRLDARPVRIVHGGRTAAATAAAARG